MNSEFVAANSYKQAVLAVPSLPLHVLCVRRSRRKQPLAGIRLKGRLRWLACAYREYLLVEKHGSAEECLIAESVAVTDDRVFQAGAVVAGRYEILELISHSASSNVYRTRHLHTGQLVAVKIIDSTFADATATLRFQREARLLSSLSHPNLVVFYAFGEIEGEMHYIAMEYLDGTTLEVILKREGPLTAERIGNLPHDRYFLFYNNAVIASILFKKPELTEKYLRELEEMSVHGASSTAAIYPNILYSIGASYDNAGQPDRAATFFARAFLSAHRGNSSDYRIISLARKQGIAACHAANRDDMLEMFETPTGSLKPARTGNRAAGSD